MSAPAIAGLILAAGASRRMGSAKALLIYQGETFLDRMIGIFRRVSSPVAVVLGHHAAPILAGISRSTEVLIARNPDPELGMLSSLQCGLKELPVDLDAVLFSPVDYPGIQPSTVRKIADAFQVHRAPVTIPVLEGRRGHPVCVSRDVVAELLALPVTAQARDVIRGYRSRTHFVEVDDHGILLDIDHPEDYRILQAHL